jgi:hypothetical protein
MHICGNLRQLMKRWENWIFAGEDAAAHARGWEVSRPPNGFGRIFRDPRWDLISACESCGGAGRTAAGLCQGCGGHGTIRHHLADAPPRGAS